MFNKVLIPVDVTLPEETAKLLAAAKTVTAGWSSALHILTVIPNMGMAIVGSQFDAGFEDQSRKAAQAELDAALKASGLDATPHLRVGRIYDSIIACAEDVGADLILIGAHQPDLRDYLIGSNAARVVRHTRASVLVLRDS